jgi:hypothetical protein
MDAFAPAVDGEGQRGRLRQVQKNSGLRIGSAAILFNDEKLPVASIG